MWDKKTNRLYWSTANQLIQLADSFNACLKWSVRTQKSKKKESCRLGEDWMEIKLNWDFIPVKLTSVIFDSFLFDFTVHCAPTVVTWLETSLCGSQCESDSLLENISCMMDKTFNISSWILLSFLFFNGSAYSSFQGGMFKILPTRSWNDSSNQRFCWNFDFRATVRFILCFCFVGRLGTFITWVTFTLYLFIRAKAISIARTKVYEEEQSYTVPIYNINNAYF